MKFFSKYIRQIKRWVRKNKSLAVFIACLIAVILLYAYYMNTKRLSVDPVTYTPLLSLIARAESNDNYNAYYSNSQNTKVDFTNMTIAEVLKWQSDFIAQGSPSSAVGRYQILNTTLTGLVKELDIDTNQIFDQSLQDQLAIRLLERRGSIDYINGDLSKTAFAANLAKEWAALPKVIGNNPESSYYAGDGLNKSRLSTSEVLMAIDFIEPDESR